MDVIEIDGSQGEGGGQIIRTSISLSCIFRKPVRIINIRANRREPGLRPQHLQAVKSAAEITNSKLVGAQIGSKTVEFVPGEPKKQVSATIDTGTAGSTTLIAQTLIPVGIFCKSDFDLEIRGGTENPLSPTVDFLQRVVVPFYRAMGGTVTIDLVRRGYYPRGGGIVKVVVKGREANPHAIDLDHDLESGITEKSSQNKTTILSVSRLLPDHVAKRQADAASIVLSQNGVSSTIETDSAGQALSPGSSILIYSTQENRFVGVDELGQKRKRAEKVGEEAALDYLQEINANASLDAHLADMAVTLLSCIDGKSKFTTSRMSSHLMTNLRVASALTDCKFNTIENGKKIAVEVEGTQPWMIHKDSK